VRSAREREHQKAARLMAVGEQGQVTGGWVRQARIIVRFGTASGDFWSRTNAAPPLSVFVRKKGRVKN
jgi:hypothetical protein